MRLFVLIFSILIYSCQETESKVESSNLEYKSKDSSSIIEKFNPEKWAIEMIRNLAEVRILIEEIRLNSNEKNHLTIWTAGGPETTKLKYYWVKVGEDNGENTVTLLNFYVDPISENILYYDVVKDSLVKLEDWRK